MTNDLMGSSERYVMGQENLLEPSNAIVDKDKQFFEIELETNATIESLATLTIYYWQSADATNSPAFSATSQMRNSIIHADNNGDSSTFYRHLI